MLGECVYLLYPILRWPYTRLDLNSFLNQVQPQSLLFNTSKKYLQRNMQLYSIDDFLYGALPL